MKNTKILLLSILLYSGTVFACDNLEKGIECEQEIIILNSIITNVTIKDVFSSYSELVEICQKSDVTLCNDFRINVGEARFTKIYNEKSSELKKNGFNNDDISFELSESKIDFDGMYVEVLLNALLDK